MEKKYDQFAATEGRTETPVELMQKGGEGKVPARLKKQMEGYKTVLTKLMHSKELRKQTMEMLKSGPPEIAVPQTAITINRQAEEMMQQKGIDLSNDVKLNGALFLVNDLIILGNSGAEWDDPVDKDEATAILQDTMQDYIKTGLANGTIDPIQLQKDTEPLLNDEQKKLGLEIAQQEGIPNDITQQQVVGNQERLAKTKAQGKSGGVLGGRG